MIYNSYCITCFQVHPRATLAHALYLGLEPKVDGEPSALFTVSRPRRVDRARADTAKRSVYQVSFGECEA